MLLEKWYEEQLANFKAFNPFWDASKPTYDAVENALSLSIPFGMLLAHRLAKIFTALKTFNPFWDASYIL